MKNMMAPENPLESKKGAQEIIPEEKLKVAEVLLGGNNFNIENLYEESKGKKALDPEKAKAVIQEIETSFSPKAIEQAKVVISAREESVHILEQSYELKKKSPEPKKVKIAEINTNEQKNAKINHETAIIELKKILAQDEIAKLRTKYNGNPKSEQLIKEELINGADGKGTKSYFESLRRLSVMELNRMNDARERIDSRENSKVPEILKKTFGAFAKIRPRALRSVVGTTIFGAAIVGGSVALSIPIAGAAAGYGGYFVYRAARAVVGGSISALVQKYFTNKIVEKAYKVDTQKAFSNIKQNEEQKLAEKDIADELLEMDRLEDLSSIQNFETDKQLAEEYSKRMRKAKHLHTANAVGSGIITGAAGGLIGAKAVDFGGGLYHDITETGEKAVVPNETIPDTPKNVPMWESVVAKKGDSVWSVVEHNLEKNISGFKGMTEAQRTYVIDHYKDYVEANPEKFGLTNANQIKVGWGKEVENIFTNKQKLAQIISEAKGLKPEEVKNILHTNELNRLHPLGITAETAKIPEAIAQTPKELHAVFSPEDQIDYEQALRNYRGDVFGKDSAEWNITHEQDVQTLLALAHDHPEVMQNGAYQEFKSAVRNIYSERLQSELGEGGMFKFVNSADHEDLVRETAGIAQTFGLNGQEAQMYPVYLGQGQELDENVFRPFVNAETGEISMNEFARSIGQFSAIVENHHDIPEIPLGKTTSAWEPRTIYFGDKNYLGLVRNIGDERFEYQIEPGEVHHASKLGMESLLQGNKADLEPLPVKGIEDIKVPPPQPIELKEVTIPPEVEARVAEMQKNLPHEVEQFVKKAEAAETLEKAKMGTGDNQTTQPLPIDELKKVESIKTPYIETDTPIVKSDTAAAIPEKINIIRTPKSDINIPFRHMDTTPIPEKSPIITTVPDATKVSSGDTFKVSKSNINPFERVNNAPIARSTPMNMPETINAFKTSEMDAKIPNTHMGNVPNIDALKVGQLEASNIAVPDASKVSWIRKIFRGK